MNDCQNCPSGSSCSQNGECRLPPGILTVYNLDQSTADGLMVWLELVRDGDQVSIDRTSLEILGKAREIYDGRIFGVMFGDIELKPLYDQAFSYGVNTLYHVKDKRMIEFNSRAYSEAFVEIVGRIRPAILLIGATVRGKAVAETIAWSLGIGVTEDCVDLSIDKNKLMMIRDPSAGGPTGSEDHPQMATVLPGSFGMPVPKEGAKGTMIYWQYRGDAFGS